MTTQLTDYITIDNAYQFINKKLFENELPDVVITLQRKANSRGYFHPENFSNRHNKSPRDELALNPATFEGISDREILSNLAHEMTHVWQEHFGTPSRNGYHNKQWGIKMDEIGLCPSHNGEKDGKRTGQSMTHYIVKNGKYDTIMREYLKSHKLIWQSKKTTPKDKAQNSKQKYTCPKCNQNAWGKPELNINCGDCKTKMECEP